MAQGYVSYRYNGSCLYLKGRKLGGVLVSLEKQGGTVVTTLDGYVVTMPDGTVHEFTLA
ncbi:MAG: hypothetical protein ACREHG_01345 [Candidatus Saccharimonadales bacterium]